MTKKILIKILLLLSFFIFFEDTNANIFIEKTIDGHKIKVIKYDLSSDKFIFKVGVEDDYEATDLRGLMEENNGISAVNGVYLCPADYGECGGKDFTINERYVEGKKYGPYDDTGERVVFALDENNLPFLFQTNKINTDKEEDIYNGLANFPLLLQDGKNVIEHYREVGLIDNKMKVKMSRNFICSDKGGKNLYFGYVYGIELNFLHSVLTKLGCYNAINLDAGSSSAMIYNSRYLIGPGRKILDAMIIERKGLDTEGIRNKIKIFIDKLEKNFKYEKIGVKVKYLDKLSKKIAEARKKIYEINSINLYDENGEYVGYEIHANGLNTLSKLYLINYLDKLIYELKIKFVLEDKNRKIIDEPMF